MEFMVKHDIQNCHPHQHHEPPTRMQGFSGGSYKGADLRNLNNCHMFLRVVTLSDISSGGDGQYILPFAWHLRQTTLQRTKKLKWPANSTLTPIIAKRLWKVALARCFLTPDGTKL
eukprot:scaffold61301_cov45-Attheya_sp.AAC.4